MILKIIEKNSDLARRILDKPNYPVEVSPWVLAEVVYVVRHEAPVHLEDVLCRRMEICWLIRPEYQGQVATAAASVMGGILGWSKSQIKKEITSYLEYVKKNSFFFEGEIPVPKIN